MIFSSNVHPFNSFLSCSLAQKAQTKSVVSPRITRLKIITLTVASLFLLSVQAKPQNDESNTNIALEQLGAYQLNFENVTMVDHVSGQNLLARSQAKTGENFAMYLPFTVQHTQFLSANGAKVVKDQPIAILTGSDVHHFLEEYHAAKILFNNASQQYQTSLGLYKKKALSQSRWTEISNSYFTAKLHFGHLTHLKKLLSISHESKGTEEVVSIISPIAGILRYSTNRDVKEEGKLLFDIIPHNAMRLKISAPLKNIKKLRKVKVLNQNCTIDIDIASTQSSLMNNFNTIIWSDPIKSNCNISLGENLVVSPVYQQTAFSIDKNAIFEINNRSHIAIKNDQQLELVPIEILASNGKNYLFTSQENLAEKPALTSSVSAVQGILLELGSGAQ
jgi:hypothetical protein